MLRAFNEFARTIDERDPMMFVLWVVSFSVAFISVGIVAAWAFVNWVRS